MKISLILDLSDSLLGMKKYKLLYWITGCRFPIEAGFIALPSDEAAWILENFINESIL